MKPNQLATPDPTLQRIADLQAALEIVTRERDAARAAPAEALRLIGAGVYGEALRVLRAAAEGEPLLGEEAA